MAKATPASIKKSLMKACTDLEARYKRYIPVVFEDFIEALIFQILYLATSEKAAQDALKRIKAEYVDYNDMRVASVREIQDILGPKYVRCREKAEDLHSLLADLYTAFRRMDLTEMVATPEGIETLRALPDTTLIRVDMVETALLTVCRVPTFPCDEDQFNLLQFLGACPKDWDYETGMAEVREILNEEEMLRLSHGLREHTDVIFQADEFDPQPLDFGLEKGKKTTKKPPAKKRQ